MLLRLTTFLLALTVVARADGESLAVLEHVEVELVAGHESVQPGSESFVGLLFKLDPGWHVYWKNPGDSGEPPTLVGADVGRRAWEEAVMGS